MTASDYVQGSNFNPLILVFVFLVFAMMALASANDGKYRYIAAAVAAVAAVFCLAVGFTNGFGGVIAP